MKELLDLSDLDVKRRLMAHIGTLKGLHEVIIKERKRTRTLDQNAYYHVAFVDPFMHWLQENWGERIDHDQAHETLKLAVMDIDRVEGLAIMPSTKNLDTADFSIFLEKAAEFLATKCEIVVIPADLFYEGATKGKHG